MILVWDFSRLVILLMFGLTIGYVAWIIRVYAAKAKRLLPRHIATVGTSFLLALGVTAWQNIIRVGEEFSLYIPVNFVTMAFALYSMRLMVLHLRREHVTPRRRKSE